MLVLFLQRTDSFWRGLSEGVNYGVRNDTENIFLTHCILWAPSATLSLSTQVTAYQTGPFSLTRLADSTGSPKIIKEIIIPFKNPQNSHINTTLNQRGDGRAQFLKRTQMAEIHSFSMAFIPNVNSATWKGFCPQWFLHECRVESWICVQQVYRPNGWSFLSLTA